jgi:hypothetical protein
MDYDDLEHIRYCLWAKQVLLIWDQWTRLIRVGTQPQPEFTNLLGAVALRTPSTVQRPFHAQLMELLEHSAAWALDPMLVTWTDIAGNHRVVQDALERLCTPPFRCTA